jgi:hypothetical protein
MTDPTGPVAAEGTEELDTTGRLELYAKIGGDFPPIRIDALALAEAIRSGRPARFYPQGYAETATDASGRPQVRELGKTVGHDGTVVQGGQIEPFDHNEKITAEAWYGAPGELGIVETMRREDTAVSPGVATWIEAISSDGWKVHPHPDGDELDLEIARFCQDCYDNTLRGGIQSYLERASLAVFDGAALFEQVYRYDEAAGRMVLDQLAPRPLWTIEQWLSSVRLRSEYNVAAAPGSWGVIQYPPIGDEAPVDGTATAPVLVPDKLQHLIYQGTGNNPTGLSILRPCNAPYRFRKRALVLAAQGYERAAFGIPYVEADPAMVSMGGEDDLDLLLSELRTGIRAWLKLPPGYKLHFADFPMKSADLREDVVHYGKAISRALGVMHQWSGEDVGSFSQIKGQIATFEGRAQSFGDYVARVQGEGTSSVLHRLADYNWNNVKLYPTMRAPVIRAGDWASRLESLGAMVGAGIVKPAADLEEFARQKIGAGEMPETSREAWEAAVKAPKLIPEIGGPETPPDPDDPPEGAAAGAAADDGSEGNEADGDELKTDGADGKAARGRAPHVVALTGSRLDPSRIEDDLVLVGPHGRDARPVERCVRFSETRGATDAAKVEVGRVMESWRKKEGARLAEAMVESGDLASARRVQVKGRGRLSASIEKVLRRVYRGGVEAVDNEVERLKDDPELLSAVEEGEVEVSRDDGIVELSEWSDLRLRVATAERLLAGADWRLEVDALAKAKAPKVKGKGSSIADEIDPEEAIRAIAGTTADASAARLHEAAIREYQALAIGGTIPSADYPTASARIADTLARLSAGQEVRRAQEDVNTISGLGRLQAARGRDDLEGFIVSNLIESETCVECEAIDGRRFKPDQADEYATPYARCLGGAACNCLQIWIPKKAA